MRKILLVSLSILLVCLNTVNSFAQDGSPDSTFDFDGIVITDFANTDDYNYCFAVQPDGKIIVAGITSLVTIGYDLLIIRYNTDGSLDTSFGNAGIVSDSLGRFYPGSMVIQPDGKLVIGGSLSQSGLNQDEFMLVRYNSNGIIDSTFGTNGITHTDYGNLDNAGGCVLLQPDGKILLGGATIPLGQVILFALLRYNTDGSIDSSFAVNGIATNSFDSLYLQRPGFMVLRPDGKIVQVGYGAHNNGSLDVLLIRYNSDGSLDSTFDNDGKLLMVTDSVSEAGVAIALQNDGKMVVGGGIYLTGPFFDLMLMRLNSDGSIDSSFNSVGFLNVPFNMDAFGRSMVIQPDGKIILAGFLDNGNDFDFTMTRANSDGSIDSTFDGDGIIPVIVAGTESAVINVGLQQDGKILLAGPKQNSTSDFFIERFNNNIIVDVTDQSQQSFELFPNPGSGIFNIRTDMKNYNVSVCNMLGENVYTKHAVNDDYIQMDISNYSKGVYLVRLYNGSSSVIRKIVLH